jgi:hypothetical protein
MARLLALVIAATVLASCSGRNVSDYIPQWAGGPPNNLPPRPGTPEYDAWKQQFDAEAARDKSKDAPKDSEKKDLPHRALFLPAP